MSAPRDVGHLERGGSWLPPWPVVAGLVGLFGLDAVLPQIEVPAVVWAVTGGLVLAGTAVGWLSARRLWTVELAGRGQDATLRVGREELRLADVDLDHLRAVCDGAAGAGAGSPVLGGSWSVPKGSVGLPLRRVDGTTVLVPTRVPRELGVALLTAHPASGGDTGAPGTVGP
ncbi:hypothetical protein O2W15_08540 [Modestobacter sp. VKM Ac-2979]|uniref:hypothetical protein n=1 Tax=unclassified Modestobacter TaxID=2643866 RepID=UPI0022AB6F3E|nr:MULTISPECIES: hypothetical protein [unclassified Modestobacter]MCZ2811483.1 hypothetical protein [Modestobacter sp. VKM Ac-2979]MCZ2840997.1 hypothetical protein [Modestobacter sp. VKM Ac-2980]